MPRTDRHQLRLNVSVLKGLANVSQQALGGVQNEFLVLGIANSLRTRGILDERASFLKD